VLTSFLSRLPKDELATEPLKYAEQFPVAQIIHQVCLFILNIFFENKQHQQYLNCFSRSHRINVLVLEVCINYILVFRRQLLNYKNLILNMAMKRCFLYDTVDASEVAVKIVVCLC